MAEKCWSPTAREGRKKLPSLLSRWEKTRSSSPSLGGETR